MGNRSSKKHAKMAATAEGDGSTNDLDSEVENAINRVEGDDTSKSDKPKKKKEKVKKEKEKKEIEKKEKKEKEKKEKEKKEKEKKEKKEKVKKDKKTKDKKEKKKSKKKAEYKELPQPPEISDLTSSVDVTNFNGDTRNLEDAVTISVKIEPTDSDNMRGKENTRPNTVYEGRSARQASPNGPGVSALREKFGAKATGTPCRPVSYPASRLQNESPTAELRQPVHRKSSGFNRLEETPQKQTGKNENADGNVSALKQKFGGTHAASPPSPTGTQNTSFATPTTKTVATPTTKTVATPSKFGGVANKWQPKLSSTPSDTKTTSKNHNDHAVTPTTTTTTTTTGISALRNRFNSHSDDATSVKPAGQMNIKPAGQMNVAPDKKRKKADDEKRAEEQIEKENEKNRSPRKHWRNWSPKKEQNTPIREASPTKETSPRKRKSVFNNITRSKSKHDNKDEVEESPLITTRIVDNKAEEAEKERARQLISNRTSALIYGVKPTPQTITPSRVQFEESVPKRTRRDESPKERPKTEYNFQNVSPPRPKSMAGTNQPFSSPGNISNMTPVKGTNIIKNPTTKTQRLLQWCQIHTQGYDGVCVSNFHSSWADGLAFCALVHKFVPKAFDFNTLNSNNRSHNFDLAFSSAEKYAKVSRLLDTKDMIEMGDKPDWKCVFTYMTSLYAGLNKLAN